MIRFVMLAAVLAAAPGFAARVTMGLDGTWDVADSAAGDRPPSSYAHRVPVPGLTNLAQPPFPDVDKFDSIEGIQRRVRLKLMPESALAVGRVAGVSRQNRNWFWYRRTFRPSAKKEVVILKVAKAQFGMAVWLNGQKIGEYPGCFTAGYFNLTEAIRWDAENELVVRIGAHPAVLPIQYPTGTDNEKLLWTPGIYDSVSLLLSDNPVIETVQVAPRLATSDILVQTKLKNYGRAATVTLTNRIQGESGRSATRRVALAPGEEKTEIQTIPMPGARLWSPEQPHLYTLETSTAGDSLSTRFGFREFRFDSATRRAFLNGKPYFLRGSNITLHRFFEDPGCKNLPWDEKWARKLLAEVPKRLNWNSFRFCIGPAPDRWLEIADEAGLIIQNEFFVWGYRPEWDMDEMVRQYKDWMRDNWNHPSVAIWDAQNETRAGELTEIIRTVRALDLSNRPWENGYNLPVAADDPIEDHPYLFSRAGKGFNPADLENMTGAKSTNSAHPSANPAIINEYGWLWLNRDGTPTELTKNVYANLLGENATPAQRFETNAYYLAGLTEFWRAHRNFAGVLHFVYLTCSYPGVYTSDHWRDLAKLELEPQFEEWVGNAFRPLGVYLNFWRPRLKGGAGHRFAVMMVNDEPEPAAGTLALTLEAPDGRILARAETRFEIPALGSNAYGLDLRLPERAGETLLRAAAHRDGGSPTLSRRKLLIE